MINSMAAHEWRGESKVHDRVKELEELVTHHHNLRHELITEKDGRIDELEEVCKDHGEIQASLCERIAQLEEALEKLLSVTRHLEPCAGTVDEVEVVLDKLRNQK